MRHWSVGAGIMAALVALSACEGNISGGEATVRPSLVAFVGTEAGRPALFVQNADGTGRRRIRFAGAQELPGNYEGLPVRDENVLALGSLAWSPDGRRLAVVLTLAYDQSEVVVVDADGSNPRVASLNTQIIMTGLDWSPDGKSLVYGMSTRVGGAGVQLFITDLEAGTWRQLTRAAPVGSAGTDVRWDADGTGIYLWQTIGQTPAPDSDWLSRVSLVDTGNGDVRVIADSIHGMVQDVPRAGGWALVLRSVSHSAGQDPMRDLVRSPLVGKGPEVRLAAGNLVLARLSPDDRGIALISDTNPVAGEAAYKAGVLPVQGGTPEPLAGIEPTVSAVEVLFR